MAFSHSMTTYCGALVAAVMTLSGGAAWSAPKVVHVDKNHYSGKWLEIGRRPMFITDGCVAGYTTYKQGERPDEIQVEDGCYEGTPGGKQKTIKGAGTLVDAGSTNATLRVRYPFLITFTYNVIYKSSDASWFISTDKSMNNLWIYSRTVPSKSQLNRMISKAKALGYDVKRLEFPPQ